MKFLGPCDLELVCLGSNPGLPILKYYKISHLSSVPHSIISQVGLMNTFSKIPVRMS